MDNDPVNAAFAAILKDMRERVGLPPNQFAAVLDIGREQYADLENPEWGKSLFNIFRIAKGLDMEPELLVTATRLRIAALLAPALQFSAPVLPAAQAEGNVP